MAGMRLEGMRQAHEDLERLDQLIVDALLEEPRTLKRTLEQSHRVKALLDRSVDRRMELADLYDDADRVRQEEMNAISGSGPAVYQSFYERLRDVKEYHRRFPRLPIGRAEDALEPDVSVHFTGEENNGKCVDLHRFFQRFVNLSLFDDDRAADARKQKEGEADEEKGSLMKGLIAPGEKPLDYLQYLRSFATFSASRKGKDARYLEYLRDLFEYLVSFFRRTQPLFDIDEKLAECEISFASLYESGELRRRWEVGKQTGAQANGGDAMDEEAPKAPAATYCGPCGKHFAKESLYKSHLTGKKHRAAVKRAEKKAAEGGGSSAGDGGDGAAAGDGDGAAEAAQTPPASRDREIWRYEYLVSVMGQLLSENVEAALAHVTKNLSRTYAEIEADLYELEEGESDDEDEEEDMRVGIKDYPVGWDGKPIPFWLYKLHGLGVEYKCEICGNASYMGRRAFERHFQDWRHTHGMRCLGIPNTIHFQDITKIKDAVALWERLQKLQSKEEWNPDEEEEFEDSEGRVLPKKTYRLLEAQNML